jgi:SAM-dependent methyltransferase
MVSYALRLGDEEVRRYRAMAQTAVAVEQNYWEAAGICRGAAVADVGCGPGAVSVLLAKMVGREGHVWAVDADPQAVQRAATFATGADLSHVEAIVGDAAATGLPVGQLDVAMLRHVLAHNGGREQAIVDHLASLVRPGGCVYLTDVDGTAVRLRPKNRDLEDLYERYEQFHLRRGNDISVGLRLDHLLRTAGLDLVNFSGHYGIEKAEPCLRGPAWAAREAIVEAGLATPADIARWSTAFERTDSCPDRPTVFIPIFVAIGRTPT